MTNEIKSTWISRKKGTRIAMLCSKSKKTVCFPCWQRLCQGLILATGEHCYRCSSRKEKKFTAFAKIKEIEI